MRKFIVYMLNGVVGIAFLVAVVGFVSMLLSFDPITVYADPPRPTAQELFDSTVLFYKSNYSTGVECAAIATRSDTELFVTALSCYKNDRPLGESSSNSEWSGWSEW